MTKRMRRSVYPTAYHVPTGTHFAIIGARQCQAGKCFVVREFDNARERLFLLDGFSEMNATEKGALFETLIAKETARTKCEAKKARALEIRRHNQGRDPDEQEKVTRWNEPSDPLESIEDDESNSEVIAREDTWIGCVEF